ncbi:MAG: hypothetical protein AAF581_02705 [Planctomycetota bacterium]
MLHSSADSVATWPGCLRAMLASICVGLIFSAGALLCGAAFTEVASAQETPNESSESDQRWQQLLGTANYLSGMDAGLTEARFSGRPILLFVAYHDDARTELLGEWILRQQRVRARLESFVLVAIDGASESGTEVARRYDRHKMRRQHPYLRFLNPAGDAVGMQIGFVGDAVPFPPAMAKFFLEHSKRALADIKPRLSAAYRKLLKADADLEHALAREKHAKAVKAILAIEKIQHPGAVLDRALAAKERLQALAEKRLQESEALIESDRAAALRHLKKLASEFKGLAAADRARTTLRRLKKKS